MSAIHRGCTSCRLFAVCVTGMYVFVDYTCSSCAKRQYAAAYKGNVHMWYDLSRPPPFGCPRFYAAPLDAGFLCNTCIDAGTEREDESKGKKIDRSINGLVEW